LDILTSYAKIATRISSPRGPKVSSNTFDLFR
jgi:hypothetical protein